VSVGGDTDRQRRRLVASVVACVAAALGPTSGAHGWLRAAHAATPPEDVRLPGDPATWQALREGGHAILIRHAIAPGGGDPTGFRLGDCATQRNLSDEGREQARRIGRTLRAAGVKVDRVLSSRWCRGLDTARMLGLGEVEPFPPLDSFFRTPEGGPAAVDAMARFVAGIGQATVVMVTHQVNITGLTGVYPASGEAVVIAPLAGRTGGGTAGGTTGIRVVGRLAF
jgi:phosphohistidine phosphatase SixA